MNPHRVSFTLAALASLSLQSFASAQSPAATPPAQSAPAATAPDAPAVPFRPIPHLEKRGSGPINLILIPGLACDWTVFESFMDRNKDRYTMYAVTLPGFGGSTPPEFPVDPLGGAWLDNAVQAVWKIVDDNKIENPVIVGHSLGGHLAFRAGIARPKQTRAVIAIDGTPAFSFGGKATLEQRQTAAISMKQNYEQATDIEWKDSQRAFFSSMVTNPVRGQQLADMSGRTPKEITIEYLCELLAADLTSRLPGLTAPILLIPSIPKTEELRGTTSDAMRTQWQAAVEDAPNATVVFFEDTRHFIQDDRPRELDAAIDDFLHQRPVKGVPAQQTPADTRPATAPAAPGP